MSATRRNDPCPCGSLRRYKDCHGRLDAAPEPIDRRVQSALAAHQQGRIDAAERGYRDVLEREPGHAIATHYLGLVAWQRGELAVAESEMRASIAANAAVPDFHNNLGLLLRDTGRVDEAAASFRKALEVDPGWFEAYNNLGLTLESAGRWNEAIAAYRAALERQPRFAAAQQNLARVLLTRGEFAEGWSRYRWRLLAQAMTREEPDPGAKPLPASLEGRRFVLRSEQGLGDVLFFLRFAPELARRGARLAFRGDPRLHSMLARSALFALGVDVENAPLPDAEAIFLGDLPWLLEADDAARFPPALRLAPEEDRRARLVKEIGALGDKPVIALTWRAGVDSAGPSRSQLKTVPVDALGRTLRDIRAVWISVQRNPGAGEREALAAALGAPLHDYSRANDDLEEMLALMSVADEYAGVSNANFYLRAAAGRGMQALVAHPPEWRWGLAGPASPWFAATRLHRQLPDGDWAPALASLRNQIKGSDSII